MRPIACIGILWLTWIAVWAISALSTNPTAKAASYREEAPYRLLGLAGAVFLGSSGFRNVGLLPPWGWVMVAMVAVGLGFAVWARWHLGRYWSAAVTKKDHHLIDTDPYAIVRHPIYTGVIAALTATAVVEAQPVALIGAVLFAASFTVKARLEEALLRKEFGPVYAAYAARTPMLIPFWPRTG